jgi:anti-sigma regulatory factor (Ser/Thr protein kinase)
MITAEGECSLLEVETHLPIGVEDSAIEVIDFLKQHGAVFANVNDDVLTLVIKDHGAAFDPTQHEEVDIDAELDERAIGGLGIHLVRTIMDTVEYQRTSNGYNLLVLTKNLKTIN